MKTRQQSITLVLIFLILTMLTLQVQAQTLCAVSTKGSPLARDQRDDQRLKCLKEKKNKISVFQCLKVAKSMEYSTNAEETRMLCLNELRPSLKECFAITKAMEYPDSGDEVRWECIRRFNKTITLKQCEKIANDMSYPANSQRAQEYCRYELR